MKHSTAMVMGVAAVVGFVGYVFGHKRGQSELKTSGRTPYFNSHGRHQQFKPGMAPGQPGYRHRHHHYKRGECKLNYSGLTHDQAHKILDALRAGTITCERAEGDIELFRKRNAQAEASA